MSELISKELKDFVKEGGVNLPEHLIIEDKEKRLYRRVIKLMEELGEFSDAILAHSGRQRNDKLAEYDSNNLAEEFADVLITLLLVADTAGIDIEKSLRGKMEKIKERFSKK